MSITLSALQQQRRDTAANWTSANPTLLAGELGYETDTGKWKVGDGSTAWTALGYTHWSQITAYPLATADIANDAITGDKLANDITIANNLTVTNDLVVNGTTTTINSTTLTVDDKNIELGTVATPSDTTADGGGITLKGATDKTLTWVNSTDCWTFNQSLNLPAGSGSTPALIFNGDVNTGLFQSAADEIAVATGGTQRLAIDSSGRLLVGTTSGSYKTEIVDESEANLAIRTYNNGAQNFAGIRLFKARGTESSPTIVSDNDTLNEINIYGYDGSNFKPAASIKTFVDGTPSTNDMPGRLVFSTTADGASSPTERMRLTSDGKLGVGTTSPSTKFVVSNSGAEGLEFSHSSGTSEISSYNRSTSARAPVDIIGQTFKVLTGNPSLSTGLFQNSSGKVGIGTSSLDSYDGNSNNLVIANTSGNAGMSFVTSSTGDGTISWADGTSGNERYRGTIGYNHTNDKFTISTAASPAVTIDSSGNVGIGQSSPNALLEVNSGTAGNEVQRIEGSYSGSGSVVLTNWRRAGGAVAANIQYHDTSPIKVSLGTSTSHNFALKTGDSDRVTIDSSGNVGIGLSSPSQPLHVDCGAPGSSDKIIAQFQSESTRQLYIGWDDSQSTMAIGTNNDHALSFHTNGQDAERLRLDQNGLVSTIGSGNSTNYKIRNTAGSSSSIYFIECFSGATSVTSGGTHRFLVATDGGISNYQSNDTNLCDEREKKNIETLDSTWGCLKNWELKKFHYNEDADTDNKRYGVIAQQVEEHCPELIAPWLKQSAEEAVLDEHGNVVTPAREEILRKGVKEQQMMWMAIKALQEAQARIETLEAKVAALEAQ